MLNDNLTDSKKNMYRPDIDGLRALAIILVIFFHIWPDIFKGGFVGVDIFFVISGFLITKMMVLWRILLMVEIQIKNII